MVEDGLDAASIPVATAAESSFHLTKMVFNPAIHLSGNAGMSFHAEVLDWLATPIFSPPDGKCYGFCNSTFSSIHCHALGG
jgi:hypothetical protein